MIKNFLFALACASILTFPMISCAQNDDTEKVVETPNEENANTYKYLNLFGEVFERSRAEYVDEVTDKELIEAALSGMLSELDPHSSYMNADEFADMQVEATGEFGGLGIQVTMDKGLVKVISPIDDTPAAKADIKSGDYIIEIDGAPVMGMTLSQAVDKMRGKVGTPISIRIARESTGESLEKTLKRGLIPIHTVKSRIEDGNIGYIRITQFNQKTAGELTDAMAEIKKELGDEKPVGYILDLRNNPGGVLDGAVAVSDAFLEKGEIVSTLGRNKEAAMRENATAGDLADGLPIVVLINGGSASASEIVAGALQDHGRAVILGTKSFGKGSVQTLMPLGKENGAMRLTTARYYTPSGRSIQAKGIEPDILAQPARIENLKGAEGWHESDLNGALDNNKADKSKTAKSKDKAEPETQEEKEKKAAEQDYQLARAIDLLHALFVYDGLSK